MGRFVEFREVGGDPVFLDADKVVKVEESGAAGVSSVHSNIYTTQVVGTPAEVVAKLQAASEQPDLMDAVQEYRLRISPSADGAWYCRDDCGRANAGKTLHEAIADWLREHGPKEQA